MGTSCWPFNFIHVRGDGGRVSFIRQSSPSDCRYSAGKEKTMTSQALLLRQRHLIHTHTRTWTTQTAWTHGPLSKTQHWWRRSGERGAVRETLGRRIHIHWWCTSSPPRLLSLLWYIPDRCQRHLNEEDQLQRQLVQRQLAWTRRQTEQRGVTHWDVRGSSWICWTSSLYVWQGQIKGIEEMTVCVCWCGSVWACVCVFFFYIVIWLGVWSVSILFLSISPSLPQSCLTHLGRTADTILGRLLFGMLHLPARTASLSLSLSLSPLSALLAAG